MELTVAHVQKTTAFTSKKRAAAAIEVLGWLEAGAPHKLNGLKGQFMFGMEDFVAGVKVRAEYDWRGNNDKVFENGEEAGRCGTVVCMAGAIYAIEKHGTIDASCHLKPYDLDDHFGSKIGSYRPNALTQLFYGKDENGRMKKSDLSKITAKEAAKTLRGYLETGRVKW